jgi:hypothetical protein
MRAKLNSIIIWILVVGFLGIASYFCLQYYYAPIGTQGDAQRASAVFGIRVLTSLSVITAVVLALFGDRLRELASPIRIQIKRPERDNDVIDWTNFVRDPNSGRIEKDTGQTWPPHFDHLRGLQVFCQHLLVENLTKHRAIEDCRIWLEKVELLVNNEWRREETFAVPRMIEWAPAEYSRNARTFCTNNVFDLGMTLDQGCGFMLTTDRDQGGQFRKHFPVGTTLKCTYYATADNYHAEERFAFRIEVIQPTLGQNVSHNRSRIQQC